MNNTLTSSKRKTLKRRCRLDVVYAMKNGKIL